MKNNIRQRLYDAMESVFRFQVRLRLDAMDIAIALAIIWGLFII
jgi:hypothetical protein